MSGLTADITNEDRREWARTALFSFNQAREGGPEGYVSSLEEDIIDLLTDLAHLWDEGRDGNDITFISLCNAADIHYYYEVGHEVDR